ncbi:uncharacterized protein BP5553_06326 [Venustampulla echinocandica]|uniref:Protein kinase domain-containing protein n=1 Tax=Venustampulla echinocandica TaxID=2656787 RepID=A0A370TJL1_9HELO|nr:uncharacterized protein BP5553_06326 [Venustampulla echinocandica]RDL35714.1 hypothetical protein BP5553_06326 [Venustampulla echinocandica]
MASAPNDFVGASGRYYRFKELLQERHILVVYGRDQFVLKDIPKDMLSSFNGDIRPKLNESLYIRLPLDTIPGHSILVYKYLTNDFLGLGRKQLPMLARKRILQDCLRGIAELHDRQVVHLDIKPDNIMLNCHSTGQEMIVEQVQITGLENAAYLPKGRCIKGMLAGNDNWRSPEAYFKGELNKPTDIFSFGVMASAFTLLESLFANIPR